MIPYKVQKGNRPKIEDVILSCLDGDLQKIALDFAVFMRENKMPFKLCTSTTRAQRASYKSRPICGILVCSDDGGFQADSPSWIVALYLEHMDNYAKIIMNEGLQSILWDNIFYCVHYNGNAKGCNPNKGCAGGRTHIILGKEINGICRCRPPAWVNDPNEAAIKSIKRLIELEQKARDESKNLK